MLYRLAALAALLFVAVLPVLAQAGGAAPMGRNRPIGVGDTVNVVVVGEEMMSGAKIVDDEGKITLTLAGDIRVAGMTPAQASAAVARALRARKLLRNPRVTVSMGALEQPRQFTVAGAVRSTGQYPLQTRTTLLQAIARASGPQDGARQNAVELTRTRPDGSVEKKTYDVTKAEAGTIAVLPGDYIFVPFPRNRPKVNVLTILSTVSALGFLLRR